MSYYTQLSELINFCSDLTIKTLMHSFEKYLQSNKIAQKNVASFNIATKTVFVFSDISFKFGLNT